MYCKHCPSFACLYDGEAKKYTCGNCGAHYIDNPGAYIEVDRTASRTPNGTSLKHVPPKVLERIALVCADHDRGLWRHKNKPWRFVSKDALLLSAMSKATAIRLGMDDEGSLDVVLASILCWAEQVLEREAKEQ